MNKPWRVVDVKSGVVVKELKTLGAALQTAKEYTEKLKKQCYVENKRGTFKSFVMPAAVNVGEKGDC